MKQIAKKVGVTKHLQVLSWSSKWVGEVDSNGVFALIILGMTSHPVMCGSIS